MLRLFAAGAAPFAGMTYRAMEPLMARLGPQSPGVAVGLVFDGSPAGLALGRHSTAPAGTAELLSLYVAPERWRAGFGTGLLGALEEQFAATAIRQIGVKYTTQTPLLAAFERVLAKRGWSPPETELTGAEIGPSIMQSAWARSRLPAGFEVFPWAALAASDRARLEEIRQTIPPALWPLDADVPPEPANSLGLRAPDGDLAGWMVTHRADERTVRYTVLYVREPWRSAPVSFALLAESMRRQTEFLPETVGTLAVNRTNAPMLRILQRKLSAHALSTYEVRVASKVL
jgi:GNAT superfamily N-acetyltransferase